MQMSGQDTTILASADTAIKALLDPGSKIFGISELAVDVAPLEGGMQLMQRVFDPPSFWLYAYLLVLLGLFAWMRGYYGKIVLQTMLAATNFQVASRIFNDNSMLQKQLDRILYLLYFLSTAFLLFFVELKLGRTPYGLGGALLYLFNLAILTGIFLGRIVLVNLAGFAFNRTRLFREYLYNSFLFNQVMGLVILPVLLFMVYTAGILQNLFFWLGLGLAGLVLIIRILRGFVFSFRKGISLFTMFLYLCALEIVPLALLYRWLEGIL